MLIKAWHSWKELYRFRFTLLIHSFFVNTHSRLIWQWCYLNFELKNCIMIWALRVRNTLNAALVLGISLQETKSFISSASWNFRLGLQARILWIFPRLIFISPPFHFSRTIFIYCRNKFRSIIRLKVFKKIMHSTVDISSCQFD